MSIEIFGYSTDASPVAVNDLAARCRQLGYECRVIRGNTTPIGVGSLASEDAIVGWRPSFFGNRAAEKAAAAADWGAIQKLEERDAVGACVIEIWGEPDRYNTAEELQELEDVYGPEYVAYRKSSRVRWYIRLAAGRNARSLEIAETVLRALLELRGGMYEDPMFGEFEIVEREGDVA